MSGLKGVYRPVMSFILACLLITSFSAVPAFSQTELNRISAVERSDGLGYVVRYHLSQAVDSFKVKHPETDRIQMKLYAERLDTSGIILTEPSEHIQAIRLYRLEYGYGVEIQLGASSYYLAQAYPDQNEHDLLLALTESTRDEIEAEVSQTDPFSWGSIVAGEPPGNDAQSDFLLQHLEEESGEVDREVGSPDDEPALNLVRLDEAVAERISDETGEQGSDSDGGGEGLSDSRAEDLNGGRDEELARVLYDEGYTQIHENLNFDTVVIDAGHGGRDPGTIGHGGIREKDVTLAVALKLGEYIKENLEDVEVVYTRNDDRFLELQERGRKANRARGDLFISIHANAMHGNSHVRGTEVYFLGLARSRSALEVMKRENSVVRLENGNGLDELTEEDLLIYELANAGNIAISERIAGMLEHQFRERAQRRSRGVKQAQFVVLYHASMPAILVELGFITNPEEARFLSSEYGQAIVASAIFRAIRDYKNEYDRIRNLSRTE